MNLRILSGALPRDQRGAGHGIRGGRRRRLRGENVHRRHGQEVGELAQTGLEALRLSGFCLHSLLLGYRYSALLFVITFVLS